MLSEITIFLWNHEFSQKITNGQMKSQRSREITAKRHQEITAKKDIKESQKLYKITLTWTS